MLAGQPIIINLSGDWASVTVDILLLFVTVLSVICAFCAYSHQRRRAKKAAACDLAKCYADDIIEKNVFVTNVFRDSKLDDYIKSMIPTNRIKNFDRDELIEILKDNGVEYPDFMQKVKDIDPKVVVTNRASCFCSLSEREKIINEFTSYNEDTEEVVIKNKMFLMNDFFQELSDMLNHLEWFSMSCRYGLADEKIIYQSLHQSFLETVRVLYPFICKSNVDNEDKFYTNIIWLHRKWNKRRTRIKAKTDKRRQKYLMKLKNVKSQVYSGSGV